jgi:hypothetical protein
MRAEAQVGAWGMVFVEVDGQLAAVGEIEGGAGEGGGGVAGVDEEELAAEAFEVVEVDGERGRMRRTGSRPVTIGTSTQPFK